MRDLSEKLKTLPSASGVYLMLDEYGQILYVGKAKNLKNRVRQYFGNKSSQTEKTMLLVEKIDDFRYIITNSELEALILENNLIKEHKPYYNILLKDDKQYPYIKIDIKSDFPKIEVVRKLKADGSKYFGPYMLGLSAKTILDLLHSVYPVRSCTRDLSKRASSGRECLNYHIGRCLAPCTGRIKSTDYKLMIKKVIEFLNGNDNDVKKRLKEKLAEASEREEFELCINYRDSLEALEKIVRKQIINMPRDLSLDIFAYASNGMYGVINYAVVRGGKMLGAENYPITEAGLETDILSSFIMQFYGSNPILCDEILTSETLNFEAELKEYLSERKGKKVNFSSPKGGIKLKLTDLSYNNASEHLAKTVSKIASREALTRGSVEALQKALDLPTPPKRIECYDISNISGTDKVASMVVFINGEPAKEMYRRFRIKTVKGIDDFASMKEVVSRRIGELGSSDPSFSDAPELIVVDGGKGQLSSAVEIVSGTGIDIIGLAKREEEVFRPGESEPIILSRDSLELTLLQRIRDEAHRFAVTYHRVLRGKRQTKSKLKEIEGVGDALARRLLIYFKKIENIANASADEIMKVEGFGRKNAMAVYEHFHEGDVAADEV